MLIDHHNIGFQNRNSQLTKKLYETLNSSNLNLLVCIPKFFKKRIYQTILKILINFGIGM